MYGIWKPRPLVLDTCEIGLEMEVERCPAEYAERILDYPVWTLREDGSLRDGGFEFVSTPIAGDRIYYAIDWFYSQLPVEARFSPRTSIHVHVNVLDMEPDQVAGLLLTYSVFEKLLYKFVGYGRDKNNFCVPLYDAKAHHEVIPLFLTDEFVLPNMPNLRYLGLNIDAVRKFGSLEFRHLGGTKDKVRLLQWINLLLSLKKFATTTHWRIIKHQIDRMNTVSDYLSFFNTVWGAEGQCLDTSTLKEDMVSLVSAVKHVQLDNQFMLKQAAVPYTRAYWYKKLMERKKQVRDIMVWDFGNPPQVRPRRGGGAAPRAPEREPNWRDAVIAYAQGVQHEDVVVRQEIQANPFGHIAQETLRNYVPAPAFFPEDDD
jgi:hypothetical protein